MLIEGGQKLTIFFEIIKKSMPDILMPFAKRVTPLYSLLALILRRKA